MIHPDLEIRKEHGCPNGCRTKIVRRGFYRRKSSSKPTQRLVCRGCNKGFSTATGGAFYHHKKRHLGPTVFKLLTGGFSQRRIALDLRINRKTVVRKFVWLGNWSNILLELSNESFPKPETVLFDDLETYCHTKLKPLVLGVIVEEKSRRILGSVITEAPHKNPILRRISEEKYGPRKDRRHVGREALFSKVKHALPDDVIIKTDMHTHYPVNIRRHFPKAKHLAFKSKRATVAGLGELKERGRDPLFGINHVNAMLRANINRLFPKTWCTTKKPDRLAIHVAIYTLRHNFELIGAGKSSRR